jgi:hypothetical protein
VTVAFDTINVQNVIIFIEAAVDPSGREDGTKDLTNKNYSRLSPVRPVTKASPAEVG